MATTTQVSPKIQGEKETTQHLATQTRIDIDMSTKIPVLIFFGGSLVWLLAATVFGVLASIKMHHPTFMAQWGWLTFGRVRPAHLNLIAYGWTSQVGVAVTLWLFARIARTRLRLPELLVVAAVIWNVAVLAGTIGILAGYSTGVEWLEFPEFAPPLFTVAYAIIALSCLLTFANRQPGHLYVSMWYLFGAVFWFPWLYVTANLLILFVPLQGVLQPMVNWWFGHNVLGLWLTPIGVAAAYYLIPKVLGRPIHSYYLSIVGFWALAFFYNSTGIHHLIGGPVPAWLITYSGVASFMMVIPVATVALNHHMTMVGNFRILLYSPTLRFVVFGAMSYTLVSLQGSLHSSRVVNEVTHFTHYTVAHAHLGVYAFFSMIMFGAMYYIVPRLTGREWASARLIQIHFWSAAIGITLYWVSLTWAGVIQGMMMNDPETPFSEIVKYTLPYLVGRSLIGMLMTVGHVAFAILFVKNIFGKGPERGDPTIFGPLGEYKQIIEQAEKMSYTPEPKQA
ncbi:MAG: cbb3-type cytochrome c oxidase subunit I [Gemmataceae bacterium]